MTDDVASLRQTLNEVLERQKATGEILRVISQSPTDSQPVFDMIAERAMRLCGAAIGFEGRWDYGAIGTVTNLAARLCGEAGSSEILVSRRVAGAVEDLASLETLEPLALKGFARPVPAFRVLALKS